MGSGKLPHCVEQNVTAAFDAVAGSATDIPMCHVAVSQMSFTGPTLPYWSLLPPQD